MKQWYPLSFFKTVGELSNLAQSRRSRVAITDVRRQVPIAVIDDEPLAAEVNLRSHGYNIKQIGDIKSIDEIADYRIVLCDLMGVGKHFDQIRQGAGIIEEIQLNYPSTIVVAYSGSSLVSAPARAAKNLADRTLRKDADISEWRRILDELVQDASDPAYIWYRTRLRLTEMEADTKSILSIEDAYVRTILTRDDKANTLKSAVSQSYLGKDARAVAQSLIASAIFSILTA